MRQDGTLDGEELTLDQVFIPINWDKPQYAMIGDASNELLTYAGFVLVHDNKGEMEFLFNKGVKKVVQLPSSIQQNQALSIKNHPQINGIVEFPLRRKDFRK